MKTVEHGERQDKGTENISKTTFVIHDEDYTYYSWDLYLIECAVIKNTPPNDVINTMDITGNQIDEPHSCNPWIDFFIPAT